MINSLSWEGEPPKQVHVSVETSLVLNFFVAITVTKIGFAWSNPMRRATIGPMMASGGGWSSVHETNYPKAK